MASEPANLKAVLAGALAGGARGLAAADRLCAASVGLLGVDAVAVSLIDAGVSRGTFGASDAGARVLDDMQFSCGEGPCLEAANSGQPVFVADLHDYNDSRWPAFKDAAERAGVRAVFGIPVSVGRTVLGALDLFRQLPGPLSDAGRRDAALVAQAAAQILLDVADDGPADPAKADPLAEWAQIPSLARLEVYQATGMIMAQLEVSPAVALVRLRAYAFAHDLSASEVANRVISRTLRLER